MERWTRAVIANRKKVLAAWLVLFVLGGYGASHLGDLLTNRFKVPGSEAERGLNLLQDNFDERGDGAFTLVFQSARPIVVAPARAATGGRPRLLLPSFRREASRATAEAASAVQGPTRGRFSMPRRASPTRRSTPRSKTRTRRRRRRTSAPRRRPCRV